MDWTIWISPKPSVYYLTHDLCTHPNPVLPLHPYPLIGEPTQFYPLLKGEHSFYFLHILHGECILTLAGDIVFSARIF